MTDVDFKIRGRKELLSMKKDMSDTLELEIFWCDLSTKAGGTRPWKQQMFLVSAPNQVPINVSGQHLFEMALRETALPPHKEQPVRACRALSKLPWLIKAKNASAEVDVGVSTANTAASGVATSGSGAPTSSCQLPFGIFIRDEVRAVFRDLPEELKKADAIEGLLTSEQPEEGKKWTPEESALIQSQVSAIAFVAAQVRIPADWCALKDWLRKYAGHLWYTCAHLIDHNRTCTLNAMGEAIDWQTSISTLTYHAGQVGYDPVTARGRAQVWPH